MFDYVPFVGVWLKEIIRGGADVGAETLINFYTFHTAVIPGLMTVLLVWHFWKVRLYGGVVLPRNTDKTNLKLIDTYPHLVKREVIVGLALLAFILLFSFLFDAPLQEKANPAFSPNPAKSPWYFQGIQELLLHFHPVFAVLIIPVLLLAGFLYFPFLDYKSETGKFDFTPNTFKGIILWSFLIGFVFTPASVLVDEYVLHFQQHQTLIPSWLSEGVFPLLFLLGLTYVFVLFIQRKFSRKRIDIVLALFILFCTAYIILMLIGTFFRGEGMQLIW
jgi:quinol-cytochrome oxidoreductase complex cytochrome b subunit